jgi:hypothetical protein
LLRRSNGFFGARIDCASAFVKNKSGRRTREGLAKDCLNDFLWGDP